ncbi:MAG: hypothetical protein OET79_16755, partial [Nitrospirota bacterium]|nr:hypothetical protein [Nitrospirota bacterium]
LMKFVEIRVWCLHKKLASVCLIKAIEYSGGPYRGRTCGPLIPHQSNSAREALVFQVLRKMAVRKNLF